MSIKKKNSSGKKEEEANTAAVKRQRRRGEEELKGRLKRERKTVLTANKKCVLEQEREKNYRNQQTPPRTGWATKCSLGNAKIE